MCSKHMQVYTEASDAVNQDFQNDEEIIEGLQAANTFWMEELQSMAYAYDYVVMNDDLNASGDDVVRIICMVRRRTMLHKELIDQINATFVEE